MNKKGFTLMELLVTVMIVGILSSIALPQYMRSLERARATEAMTAIKALNDAVYAYAAGRSGSSQAETCPVGFQKLATVLPYREGGVENGSQTIIRTRDFEYTLNQATNAIIPGTHCPGVVAQRINSDKYNYMIWNPYLKGNTSGRKGASLFCYGADELNRGVCDSLDLTSTTAPY